MLHELKILEKYAHDVEYEYKKAEVRINDRDFKKGDRIHFTVYNNPADLEYVEHPLNYKFFIITHVLPLEELIESAKGYVVLSIAPYDPTPPTYSNWTCTN